MSLSGFLLAGGGTIVIGAGLVMRGRRDPWKGMVTWGVGHVVYGASMLTDTFTTKTFVGSLIMMATVILICGGAILMVRDHRVIRDRERAQG